MSGAAKTMIVFGVYLLILGLTLILVPNLLLAMFAMAPTSEVWIRVVGMLVLFVGTYYIVAARNELTAVFQLSVYVRASVILFFIAFVLLGWAPVNLVLFGVFDLLGAFWTRWSLRTTGLSTPRLTTSGKGA